MSRRGCPPTYLNDNEKIILQNLGFNINSYNPNINFIRRCPHCGRPIPIDAIYCPYCGKDFSPKTTMDDDTKLQMLVEKIEEGKEKQGF